MDHDNEPVDDQAPKGTSSLIAKQSRSTGSDKLSGVMVERKASTEVSQRRVNGEEDHMFDDAKVNHLVLVSFIVRTLRSALDRMGQNYGGRSTAKLLGMRPQKGTQSSRKPYVMKALEMLCW